MCTGDIFLGFLAILFPPLAVWVKRGICSADSVINLLLCMLGYLPGLLHAWYIIAKYPEPYWEYETLSQDREGGGRVTYVFVHSNDCPPGAHPAQPGQPKPQSGMNYGATNQAGSSSAAAASSSSHPAPAPAAAPAPSTQAQPHDNAGEGPSDGPPPSYAQVVAGDHKIQTHD